MTRASLTLLLAVVVTAAAGAQKSGHIPLTELPDIDQKLLLEHTRTLASDQFEGRLPGTPGEDYSVTYLVEQFKKLGLAAGNTNGTFIQNVPLVGITPQPTVALTFAQDARRETLAWRDDYVAWTSRMVEQTALEASELVFVGYGVAAPEFKWDDYKDVDVSGKTLVVLVGDPPVRDPARPGQLDPRTFGGRAMTYYGRWPYKYEVGAAKKAAGVLIVHETESAGYPWGVVQGFGDERFSLRAPDRNMSRVAVEGWMTLERARQLFGMAGKSFDALKKAAARRDFRPVALGVTASVGLRNRLRTLDSRNVVAKLEGADPDLRDEYVVYTSHWDHLGVGAPVDGDRIYNGAADNASGAAGLLEIARVFTKMPVPPKRTVIFLSVTAEEQLFLGSQYYAEHPIYPLEKTLANVNLDGLNVNGRTKDLTVIGLGYSDLDDYAREAAAEQGRVLQPDAEPEKGYYYRSDHLSFAKQGVPAFYPDDGTDFIGKPAGYAQKVRDEYIANRYHKPQDEVLPTWDLSGAAEDLALVVAVGYRVAQAEKWPEWRPGTEFKAVRDGKLGK